MTAGTADEQFEGASMSMPSPMKEEVDSEIENAVPRNRKRPRMMRLVSEDDNEMEAICKASCKKDNSVEASQRADFAIRCVSEFDDLTEPSIPKKVHPLPNPLDDPNVLKTHVSALRLESDLFPMRLILARLMAHPTLNRKGLFNRPVDAAALGLLDYQTVVTQPMDLGTVKGRLHAVAYQARQQVAADIRLVFANAMRYNPPHNGVHKFAKELLGCFEQAYLPLGPTEAPQLETLPSNNQVVQPTVSLPLLALLAPALSSVEDEKPQQDALKLVCMEVDSVIQSMPTDDAAPIPTVSTASGPLPTETLSSQLPTSQPPASVSAPVHTQATRAHAPGLGAPPKSSKKRSSLPPFLPHSCQACLGRTCAMCKQGCLTHETSLLICGGYNCAGAKIRKGATYYITKDGSHQFCQRCHTNLPPVLPNTTDQDVFRYKQDLLKRKNEEEIAEAWIDCRNCNVGVHQVCAMHNGSVHSETSYLCPGCPVPSDGRIDQKCVVAEETTERYTFVSGSDIPVPLSSVAVIHEDVLSADSLTECAISAFIESKVQDRMVGVPNADKTVTVRVISDCSRHFIVPGVVRNHFRMAAEPDNFVRPPSKVNYKQKAIALFQKMDGLDVCIFCMYVQEYDGNDEYDEDSTDFAQPSQKKRVYIAYLDSVEHFRPRQCRTEVYHEILVSYLATARERGFQTAHIWACPPSRGNSFVFWNHPASQRTPNKERLISWYHGALSRAIDCGVVTDVKSLFESDFEDSITQLEKEVDAEQVGEVKSNSGKMLCPPLLDGDFWIEEAVRVHSISIARNLKARPANEICVWNFDSHCVGNVHPCPAMQLASLLRDRVMSHPSSVPFRKPVNAAALKLKNYHKIVTEPMDLGTVYSRCVLGEYSVVREVVEDVELVVSNAKKFNPVGHYVHIKADEIRGLFFQELTSLTKIWSVDSDADLSWECHSEMSMNLNMTLELTSTAIAPPQTELPTSVVIEDDPSSDGSRSLSSTISGPTSPMSGVGSLKEEESVHKPSSTSVLMALSAEKVSSPKACRKAKKTIPLKKLDLLVGGPEAVQQRMVGDDTWLLDKRINTAPKPASAKKAGVKRRRNSIDSTSEDPSLHRRRQSWLGEEIGDSVRKMRESFFTCMLAPKESLSDQEREKAESYSSYVELFKNKDDSDFATSSRIADARGTLLEFSQFRHFEFDTLRRAKYSTAMLLYHLHHENAPGMVPICTGCDQQIQEIRWHKVKKAAEKRRLTKFAPIRAPEPEWVREELCACCYTKQSQVDEFIPIPVTVKSSY